MMELPLVRLAAGALFLAMAVVPLVHSGEPESTEALQAAALRGTGTAAGILALAARVASRRGHAAERDDRSALAAQLVLLLVAWASVSWLASPLRSRLAHELLSLAAAGGLALAALRAPGVAMAGVGLAAASAVGLATFLLRPGTGELRALVRRSGTLADAETLGVALGAAGAAGLVVAVRARSRPALAAAALAVAGTVASLSRGAMLALAAGAIAGLAAGVRAGGRRRVLLLAAAVALAAAGCAIGLLAAGGQGALVRLRANPFREVNADVTPSRPQLAVLGIDLAIERPLLGWGPGSFPWVAPGATLRAREAGALPAEVEPWPHVQNDLVETAATLGLPGALLALALAVVALRAALRRRHEAAGAAAIALLVALAVSAALHHPLESAAGRVVAAVAIGVACRRAADAMPPGARPEAEPLCGAGLPRPRQARVRLALAMALVLLALGAGAATALLPEDAGLALRRARSLEASGGAGMALGEWRRYAALAPPAPRRAARLARAEGLLGDRPAAERTLRALLATWPRHEPARLLLGELLLVTSRREEALDVLALVTSKEMRQRARVLEERALR